MPDDSNRGKSYRRLSRLSHSPELEAELHALVDALLDQRMSDQQAQRLEHLVTTDPDVMQLYLELMHEFGAARRHLMPVPLDLGSADEGVASPNVMEESMVLPAIREADLEAGEETLLLPPSPYSAPAPRKIRRWWLGGAAAILVIGFVTVWIEATRPSQSPVAIAAPTSQPVVLEYPVRITATAALPAEQDLTDKPGTAFNAGEIVQLSKGAMELTFASGAVVVVQGPATFSAMDRNSMTLKSGTMTAHVPGPAIGFRVASPGLDVVDRGTNFGVRNLTDTTVSEIHVFDGLVDVAGTDTAGHTNSTAVHVTAGQAMLHDASVASAPLSIPFVPGHFTRDISQTRFTVPIHNTGDTGDNSGILKPSLIDPNWQIISVPNKPDWKPRPAELIANVPGGYSINKSPGRWIGVDSKLDDQPVGNFDFQTTADLTGLDPATVTATVLMAADDGIADIRVNGVSTGLSTPTTSNELAATFRTMPNGIWRSGVNKVDVIVRNSPLTVPLAANFMSVKVAWNVTALAVVHR